MADGDSLVITLTPATLPPPACYPTEQARFNAYVASILVGVTGGIQWITQEAAPADETAYWLKTDGSGIPLGAYKWSTTAAAWVPWAYEPTFGTGAGSLNAFTSTNAPPIPAPALFIVGREISFISNQNITGPATLVVDGGPSHAIVKAGTAPLITGDIVAGMMVRLQWDGINWQMQNPIYPSPSATGNYFDTALQSVPTSDHGICGPFAHLLAGKPQFVQWWLVCNTSPQSGTGPSGPVVLGYAVGDAVKLESCGNFSDTNSWPAQEADATYIQVGGYIWSSAPITVPQKSGSAAGGINGNWAINPSDWRLQGFAQFIPTP